MNTYVLSASYEFEVTYRVEAWTEDAARLIVSENCGVCLGSIQSTDDRVVNWVAPTHPTSKIIGAALVLPPLPPEAV